MVEEVTFVDRFGVGFSVNLGGGSEDLAETALALQLQHVPGADCVRAPHLFVVFLAVDAPELCSEVVDEVELADLVERGAELPVIGHVGSDRL